MADELLQRTLDAAGLPAVVSGVTSGGATSATYVGTKIDEHLEPNVYHNFADDALALEPDLVTFTLGVNNAIQGRIEQFFTDIAPEFDKLAEAGVRVIVTTNIPVLPNPNNAAFEQANVFLDEFINPWLRSHAAAYGFYLLDLNARIQEQPDWQSWYSDDGATPGYVHLWGGFANATSPGYQWMAQQFFVEFAEMYAGDANLDGGVTGADYTIWADHYGGPGDWSQGDFNLDGNVTGADYTLWADHFENRAAGESPPSALAVPEPSALALVLIGLATCACSRSSLRRRAIYGDGDQIARCSLSWRRHSLPPGLA
jgi:hypothetical protein